MGEGKFIQELKRFKRSIKSHHNISKMVLFGSRATGQFRKDSDVDLILVSPDFQGKSALARSPCFYLDWNLDYSVDFICYTPDEFEELAGRPSLVSEALKTGVEI